MRETTVDSGFYVGILASAYFWGQFLASFIWPPLSDKIGRKKSLIWGQFALTIPFMCFAASRSYWWAVFWRFINGLLQSNSPITKAYIADICDRTNSGAGMSVLAFAWGLSNVIAPTVGGLLAEPVLAYPDYFPPGSWQHAWFSHETGYPYALPPVFVFFFGFVIAIPMVLLWLPETSPVTVRDILHGRCSRLAAAQYRQINAEESEAAAAVAKEEREGLMAEGGGSDEDQEENGEGEHSIYGQEHSRSSSSSSNCGEVEGVAAVHKEGGKAEAAEGVAVRIPSYREMAFAHDSGTALGTLALLCPTWITYQELFPLFCKASPEEGGLGFSAYQIGTAMTISGCVLVIYQPLVFPKLQRRFGNVHCYRAGSLSMNVLLLVFPFYHFLWDSGAVLWGAVS